MANTVREVQILAAQANSFRLKQFDHVRKLVHANVIAVKPKAQSWLALQSLLLLRKRLDS